MSKLVWHEMCGMCVLVSNLITQIKKKIMKQLLCQWKFYRAHTLIILNHIKSTFSLQKNMKQAENYAP